MEFDVDGFHERRYAAIENKELVGVASLANVGKTVVTVLQLCVASNRRGEGRGTTMLTWIEDDAIGAGASAVSAIVEENGPLGFYALAGYAPAHCENGKVVMTKRLNGGTNAK